MIFSYRNNQAQQLETYICTEPNLYGCLHLSSIVLYGYPFGGVEFVQLFCTLKLSSPVRLFCHWLDFIPRIHDSNLRVPVLLATQYLSTVMCAIAIGF